MDPSDSFEEPLRTAHALMRQRKGEEACRFLSRAKEDALSSGANDNAALFSSVRGSYLMAMGFDEEALRAYREAERLSGNDVHYRLTTARHLIVAMDRPAEALEIASAVVGFESEDPAVSESEVAAIRREARAIRGLALLGLDQPEKAIEELQALCSPAQLPSLSWDLTLVEELSRRQLAPGSCRRYLDLVESKAREESEARVLEKVLEIKALLPADSSV